MARLLGAAAGGISDRLSNPLFVREGSPGLLALDDRETPSGREKWW